ncbi:hypothetical protein POTOM_011998 [Populus tomentosa]|uniref:Uncharacterized protein n=1 Tax=Populus tomentosa TaxID=118781 RepID=A0A8X8A4F8_POPTO|nr:hypothetical protein POTOM_011998 [Populus tomentosa]
MEPVANADIIYYCFLNGDANLNFTRSLICPSKSFHWGPSSIISSLILFNICQCRILVMVEFRRGILVDSFSSFSLPQRPKKSALVKYIINGNCVLRVKKRKQLSHSFICDNPKILQIDSGIVARSIGAGSGGFSRLVCLRVHPTLNLSHPTETFVSFTSIDGSEHEIWPGSGVQFYRENLLPNGELVLLDKCQGPTLVNRFNVNEVCKCYILWETGTVNLELWSEDRLVSKQSPLAVSHGYGVIGIS